MHGRGVSACTCQRDHARRAGTAHEESRLERQGARQRLLIGLLGDLVAGVQLTSVNRAGYAVHPQEGHRRGQRHERSEPAVDGSIDHDRNDSDP